MSPGYAQHLLGKYTAKLQYNVAHILKDSLREKHKINGLV
jgi:hypothetical protein